MIIINTTIDQMHWKVYAAKAFGLKLFRVEKWADGRCTLTFK